MPAIVTGSAPTDGRKWHELPALIAASLAALAYFASIQFHVSEPIDFDVYYHLAVTRELFANGPLQSFPWGPYSIVSEKFADKEFLFHVILGAVYQLPVTQAARFGALMGQAFIIFALAFALWRLRVREAWAFMLLLTALGSALAVRLAMCRPHLWGIGFSVLIIWMLVSRVRPAALFVAAMLYSLFHTGGWIAAFYAGVWVFWGLVPGLAGGVDENGGNGRVSFRTLLRRFDWKPLVAVIAGWTAGQVIHPNFPVNFHLFFVQNVLVPFHTTAAGNQALRVALGGELHVPGLRIVVMQWPVYLVVAASLAWLVVSREVRTRPVLTAATIALAFCIVSSTVMRRLYEMAAPFSVLALGLTWKTWLASRAEAGNPFRVLPRHAAMALAVILPVTGYFAHDARKQAPPASPPHAMAQWMAATVKEPQKIFTAQWADSAPLLYFAPWLTTLVALDPTFFYAKDRELFIHYVDIVLGKTRRPVDSVLGKFDARYVTLWKLPAFYRFSKQLEADHRARKVFEDRTYQVWLLDPDAPPREPGERKERRERRRPPGPLAPPQEP